MEQRYQRTMSQLSDYSRNEELHGIIPERESTNPNTHPRASLSILLQKPRQIIHRGFAIEKPSKNPVTRAGKGSQAYVCRRRRNLYKNRKQSGIHAVSQHAFEI